RVAATDARVSALRGARGSRRHARLEAFSAVEDRVFRLRLQRQNAEPRVVDLRRGQAVIIGRSMDCDVLLDDPSINGMHMRLSFKPDGRVHLQDYGSLVGTIVNNQRIKETWLAGGKFIQMGAWTATTEWLGGKEVVRPPGWVAPTPTNAGVTQARGFGNP